MGQNFLDYITITLQTTAIIGFLIYALTVVAFIILENRSPQSTFAWILLFLVFPVGGLVIYLFFGRSWKAFSYENKLTRQEIGGDLIRVLSPRLSSERDVIKQLTREKKASYKKRLLELVSRNSHAALTGRNQLELLQNATAKYPRLLKDLQQARHSIHLEYYIWTDDEFTRQIKAALIDRAKAGVEVRCLYDASGGKLGKAYLHELRQAGVKIHPYRPYWSIFKLHTINYRSHRKIAVIDGRIGYVGGLNLDKDQLDGGRYFDCWRDTHLRLQGEAVNILQAIFVTSWYNTTGDKLSDETYFPDMSQTITNFLPVQITISGPDSRWGAIRQLYFYMILAAEETVHIQSPFFIPDESINEALKAAALAGVDVKMMAAPRGTTYSIPYWAANTYFYELARAGVRIFLYQKGYFHPKTLNIDSSVCSVGTANMDIRSFSINYEVNAVIYDKETAEQLEHDFLDDLQYCTEFDPEEYKKRHPLIRFRDSLARLASPIL